MQVNLDNILVEQEARLESMDFQGNNNPLKGTVTASFSDQHFLLDFVMSTYLGPDVYSDNPRCSASHRLAKGLPPYTSKNLGSSFLSISQLNSLYYYLLRHANSSLVLKPNMLHMYLKGKLPLPSSAFSEDYRQFTSFFPMNIHEHKSYSASHEIVKGIVLIDDPVTSDMKEGNLERFRCLSGLDDLKIDKIKSLCYQCGYQEGKEKGEQNRLTSNEETVAGYISIGNGNSPAKAQEIYKRNNEETVAANVTNANGNSSARFQETYKRRHHCDPLPMSAFPCVISMPKHRGEEGPLKRTCKTDGPVMMPLLSVPNMEECVSDSSIIFTGTARKGICGPPVGVVDIGVSKVAYFFRVALPGARRDYCQFSCEIESDGKVLLQGSTSGGKTVKKHSRVFQMKFQQLCPPGAFTLSFSLPGPVDPRLFSPNFRSDGIFEAVIIKHKY